MRANHAAPLLACALVVAGASSSGAQAPGPEPDPQAPVAEAPSAAGGASPDERKVASVKVVGSGSQESGKGTFVGTEGRSASYQDTRVSDRSPNPWGQTGLVRINSARAGTSGYFDLSLHGRFFYTAAAPIPNAAAAEATLRLTGGPFITDCGRFGTPPARDCNTYLQTYMAGAASFGVTVFDYIEISMSGTGSGNENSEGNPRLLFSTGNLAGSVKLSLPVMVWTRKLPALLGWQKPKSLLFPIPLAFALDLRGYVPSRANALGSQFDNFYLAPTGLFTFDLYDGRGWPFRAHVNAGYVFQSPWSAEKTWTQMLSKGKLGIVRDDARHFGAPCRDARCRATQSLAAVGLEYNYFDIITYGVGFEFPFPFVTPFVEYTGEIPALVPWKGPNAMINTARYTGGGPFAGGFLMANPLAWPSYLTPGLRITPGRGLAFDLALDLGVGGRFTMTDGLATTLPWALQLGLSYAFSPFVAETEVELREVEKKVEVKKIIASVKAGGKIGGHVYDASTGKPIGDATLTFPETGGPRILADQDGAYQSYAMDPGRYRVIAEALDYDPAEGVADVSAGNTTTVDLRLNPHPRAATFKATVINEKDEAVPAKVTLTDGQGRSYELDAGEGTITSEVPPGKYNAVAKADGYLLSGKKVVVEAGSKTAEVFLLKPEPRKRLTVLTKERIEIKSTIHFEHNKARLLSSSDFILDEVVDTLLKNPQIAAMRIEGHTDNTGDPDYNLKLSEARAEAVREYLVSNGVAAERLQSTGYGDGRPIAPNTTEAGRARNRRVEFVIINQGEEEDASEPPAEPAPEEGAVSP